jgi:hypothetical protein
MLRLGTSRRPRRGGAHGFYAGRPPMLSTDRRAPGQGVAVIRAADLTRVPTVLSAGRRFVPVTWGGPEAVEGRTDVVLSDPLATIVPRVHGTWAEAQDTCPGCCPPRRGPYGRTLTGEITVRGAGCRVPPDGVGSVDERRGDGVPVPVSAPPCGHRVCLTGGRIGRRPVGVVTGRASGTCVPVGGVLFRGGKAGIGVAPSGPVSVGRGE